MFNLLEKDYLRVLFTLLPGFISYEVIKLYSNIDLKFSDLEIIITSLILSSINILIVLGFQKFYFLFRTERKFNSWIFFTFLFLNSVILGLGTTWFLKKDITFTEITSISSLVEPLTKVFKECQPMTAKITLNDGTMYRGEFKDFSYNKSITETDIVLTHVELKTKEGDIKKKGERTVVILSGKDIASIEIIPKHFCKKIHEDLQEYMTSALTQLADKLESCDVYTAEFLHPLQKRSSRVEIAGRIDDKCLFTEETLVDRDNKTYTQMVCKFPKKSGKT
ncbi:MAG: DUF6338 family protein, partial [Pseudomonadota bacterium]|nr:DUF6338 family protein [Pseudomonadota bacterium]